MPELSDHLKSRKPSAVRSAQISYQGRTDGVKALNVSIGNVSLPMHPAMQERMRKLGSPGSPFANGVVKYTPITGIEDCKKAFLNIIASSGFESKGLFVQVTNGASEAMELVVVGTTGKMNNEDRPLMLIDPSYVNYRAFGDRTGRKAISFQRALGKNGKYSLPNLSEIEERIVKHKPSALVVIPYDNPAGHLYDRELMIMLAKLCVKHGMWLISDEAYRELHYTGGEPVSIWGITEKDVPGITGSRISIETASKVWNACGLRIGAIVTDNKQFASQMEAEYSSNLCANALGMWVFGALAEVSANDLKNWYSAQREHYKKIIFEFTDGMKKELPGVIVSSPDASIYSVVDVRDIVKPGFSAREFVLWCAKEGKVEFEGKQATMLVTPMDGFYRMDEGKSNPGKTQMRISHVDTPENMRKVPKLFALLLKEYEKIRV